MSETTPSPQTPTKKIVGALNALFGKVVEAIEQERDAFLAEQNRLRQERAFADTPPAALPPWEDLGDANDDTRAKVLAMVLPLTRTRRTFLCAPPEEEADKEQPSFLFNLDAALPSCKAALAADPRLAAARTFLVPRKVNEEAFWRAWFWRVHLIKAACGVMWPTPGVSLPLSAPAATARLLQQSKTSSSSDSAITLSAEEEADRAWEAELRAALLDAPAAVVAAKTPATATATTTPAAAWEKEVEAELSTASAPQ